MSKHEGRIAKDSIRNRGCLPDRIKNAPVLVDGQRFFLCAFYDLESERPGGMALMPIPFSRVLAYAEFYDLTKEQTDDLLYFVGELDNHALKEAAAAQEKGQVKNA